MAWIQTADWWVLKAIQKFFDCSFLNSVMPIITKLGSAGLIWILVAACFLVTKKYRKSGYILLTGLIVGYLIGNLGLKYIFERLRPCWLDTGVTLLVANPSDYSFPSGHTLSSFIAATVIAKTDHRFAVPSFVLASLIAFSRLYLYVHFPSDVFISIILGIFIGGAVFAVWEKIARFYDRENAVQFK